MSNNLRSLQLKKRNTAALMSTQNKFIFVNRVSPEIAESIVEEFGAENVIQSEDGTHFDGEAYFRLFSQGQKPGQPLYHAPTEEEKAHLIEQIQGAHITVVTAASGSNHRDRTAVDNFKHFLKTSTIEDFAGDDFKQVWERMNDFLKVARPTNATSRASSLESQVKMLNDLGAASINIIYTKTAFDRQDRTFKKDVTDEQGNTTTVQEYNALKFKEHMEDLRHKGANRIVILDPHSEDGKAQATQTFAIDHELITSLKTLHLRETENAPNGQASAELVDYVINKAKQSISADFDAHIGTQEELHALPPNDAINRVIEGMQDTKKGALNRFYPNDSCKFVSLAPRFAKDIAERFDTQDILSGKLIFGPPDGMNKPEDVAVARACAVRDQTYKLAHRYDASAERQTLSQIQHAFATATQDDGCPAAMFLIEKERTSSTESDINAMLGQENVPGKTAIIIDDIIAGGGTMKNAALALKKAGATEVHAYASHGVLIDKPETGMEALRNLLSQNYENGEEAINLFDSITVTDSIPSVSEKIEALPQDMKQRMRCISVANTVVHEIKHDYRLARSLGFTWYSKNENENAPELTGAQTTLDND